MKPEQMRGIPGRRPTTVVKELDGGNILYLENLTVSFDGFKALNALTLYVEIGELRCIIGPNGAGKTTMMDVITGKTRPDEGSAWFATLEKSSIRPLRTSTPNFPKP